VETEAEASVMRLLGVSELQGFWFSAAVPANEIDGLVEGFGAEKGAAAHEPAGLAALRAKLSG
jgi:predicted signal transduction protein with EAL and GGDEF domain